MEDYNHFDIALICENGDVVNWASMTSPEYNTDFCRECGAKTIDACPSCNEPIRGEDLSIREWFGSFRRAPKFCHKCGKPYPWHERAKQVVLEYADEIGNLSQDDRFQLETSIVVLSNDTSEAQAQLAAVRLKKIVSKLGKAAGEVAYKMVVDIASEIGKKTLLP